VDQDTWQKPGMVDGYTARDFGRGDLVAIRQHAASLDDCGLLLISEYDCMSAIIERCDELIRQYARKLNKTLPVPEWIRCGPA
jgi:hypothetical protein